MGVAQILEITTIFAGAVIVAICAVVAWSIYSSGAPATGSTSRAIKSLSDRVAALEATGKHHASELRHVATLIERTASAKLLVEVADLAGALDSLRASNRREFGRIWGKLGGRTPEESEPLVEVESPDEVRARLRGQLGLPRVGRPANVGGADNGE